MTKQYNNALKRLLCDEVCLHGKSTIKTAEKYDVPLKTFEIGLLLIVKIPTVLTRMILMI